MARTMLSRKHTTVLIALCVIAAVFALGCVAVTSGEMSNADTAESERPEHQNDSAGRTPYVSLRIGEAVVRAEVAVDPSARRRGLSGRTSLEEGAGMLFVFPESDLHGIWMPDMRFAIDILWLDEGMRVVHVHERATPESYPEVFRSQVPARYVLEVPEGFLRTHGVRVGDQVFVHAQGEPAAP